MKKTVASSNIKSQGCFKIESGLYNVATLPFRFLGFNKEHKKTSSENDIFIVDNRI